MKKEYLFFLIMVLVAAIITGATIGFISNFQYIMNNSQSTSQVTPSPYTSQDSEQPGSPEASVDIEDTQPLQSAAIDTDISSATVAPSSGSSEQGYLVLSSEEKQEIIDMLVSLGANQTADYSNFISDFQQNHSLTPTGSLDSLTLNAIIMEVTRQRATQMVNG